MGWSTPVSRPPPRTEATTLPKAQPARIRATSATVSVRPRAPPGRSRRLRKSSWRRLRSRRRATRGRASQRCQRASTRRPVPDDPAGGEDGQADDDGGQQQEEAGLLGDLLEALVAVTCDVAEEHEPCRPQGAARDVVDGEGPVRHAGHAGHARYQGPQGGGEAAQEHRLAAPLGQVPLGPSEVVGLHEPPDGAVQQPPAEVAADLEADGVADYRPGDGRGQGGGQRHLVVVGEDTAEQHRDLAREDKPQEGGGLEGRDGEDDEQGEPAVQVEDAVGQAAHGWAGATRLQAGADVTLLICAPYPGTACRTRPGGSLQSAG